MKPIILRRKAKQDLSEAFSYYLKQAGKQTASKFLEAFDQTKIYIQRSPSAGTPRYGVLLKIADLRCWRMNGFPYALFYIEQKDRIDALRLLHQHAQIASMLEDEINP